MSEEQIFGILENLWFDYNEFGIRNLTTMYPEVDVPDLANQAIERFIRFI